MFWGAVTAFPHPPPREPTYQFGGQMLTTSVHDRGEAILRNSTSCRVFRPYFAFLGMYYTSLSKVTCRISPSQTIHSPRHVLTSRLICSSSGMMHCHTYGHWIGITDSQCECLRATQYGHTTAIRKQKNNKCNATHHEYEDLSLTSQTHID